MAFRGGRKRKWCIGAAMVAIIAAIILLVSAKIGLHVERVAVDSDALLEFAASGRKAGQGDLDRISDIVVKGALLYGHRWITETVDEAGARSTAPWTSLNVSIGPPERVVDEENPVLIIRLEGILSIVAEASGDDPSSFSVHITSGRGISAYSLVDGSIYLSYMLAAGCTDDQVAFALAHEIRHLRACHYYLPGSGRWTVEEPHAAAFDELSEEGFVLLAAPSGEYFDQETECDEYAAFITAYCGYDPKAGLALMDRLPEGDGMLFPSRAERKRNLENFIGRILDGSFVAKYLPAVRLANDLKMLLGSGQNGKDGMKSIYAPAMAALRREAAALDALMALKPDARVNRDDFGGIFETVLETRLEEMSASAVTLDVVLVISSKGISGMTPAFIALKALMLDAEEGWALCAAFDTPGRSASWLGWMAAEDRLPNARPKAEGITRYALDALSAWKASFVKDPQLHMMCYSQSGVVPYVESENLADRAIDLASLSTLFSSLKLGSDMRIFDIASKRAGQGFVSISFGYIVSVGDFPVIAGHCRLGMVPERGGWAVAGVSLY